MAHSPIIVKDSTHIVKNPRQEFYDEEIDKIRGGKGMVLKGYKTEKMRIEEHLRNINFYYPKKEEKIKEQNSNIKINESNNYNKLNATSTAVIMKQPEMRFKPRTDLERIFDEINKNSFRKLDKNIIEKQLKTLEMNSTKKFTFENEQNNNLNQAKDEIPDYNPAFKMDDLFHDDLDYLNIEKEKTEENKGDKEKKLKIEKSRKKELNLHAKNLMKEFHNKTHFKGVTSMVNFKNQTCIYLFSKKKFCFLKIFYFLFTANVYFIKLINYSLDSPERKKDYNRTSMFLNNNNNNIKYLIKLNLTKLNN